MCRIRRRTLIAKFPSPASRASTDPGVRVTRGVIGAVTPLRTAVTVVSFSAHCKHAHSHVDDSAWPSLLGVVSAVI